MTRRIQNPSWLAVLLALALFTACGEDDGGTSSTASDAIHHEDGSIDDSAGDVSNGEHPADSAFFPPPAGDFGHYRVGDTSGETAASAEWLLAISTDSTSFEGEAYTLMSFGDASGESGMSVRIWADLFDPVEADVRQIEFHQEADLNGVDWWPLGPIDSDLRVTFTEPLKMDFSGQAGGLVSSSGMGEIVLNDGIPMDAAFTATLNVIGHDVAVDVPYGTIDRVVEVVMNLTHTTVEGSASFGATFYLHPDLGVVAADLDGGLEAIALASLAAG